MSGTISFNPYVTTVPANSFLNPTQGYVSGVALDDPSSRMWLAGGVLDPAETVVMWGGVPISVEINNTGSGSEGLGWRVKRATSQGNTLGFSVFNQAASMVIVPGSSAPTAAVNNYVSFYRIGSGQVRIAVNADPAYVAALTAGELTNAAAPYWDATNMRVTSSGSGTFQLPTSIQLLSVNTSSKITSWTSPNLTWTAGDVAILAI